MKLLLAVMAGGAIGAGCRHLMNVLFVQVFSQPLFWATFTVNVGGSFLMGLVYQQLILTAAVSETMRLFLAVGLLGALTTWSTFSMEVVMMLKSGAVGKGLWYVMFTSVACFGAFWLGLKT